MPQSGASLHSMDAYFHADLLREGAIAKLRNLHQEQPAVTHVLFRIGSEAGTFAVSTIEAATGALAHYKIRQVNQLLGMERRDQAVRYQDVSALLDTLKMLGTLVPSPHPCPLFRA